MMMLIINPRAGWNMEEVARLVAAYRFAILNSNAGNFVCCRDTDGGQGLAMVGWKEEQDTVDNQVSTLNTLIMSPTFLAGSINCALLRNRVWGRRGRKGDSHQHQHQ